jgi:MOSC domain-containing protein YiiM
MMNVKEIIIESLNIGLPGKETFHGKVITTGICKQPVTEELFLRKMGFEGDGVADLKHHGGYDKAVCVYNVEHYPYWEEALGLELSFAAFGENLSVSNLLEDEVCIGDVFKLGTAVVQVSQPRQPCRTLAARYGRSDFVKMVVDSGRTGFYFKVLREGKVKKTETLLLMEKDPENVTVAFANQIYHHDRMNREGIEKVLAVTALSYSWTESFLELKKRCQ